MIGPPGKSMIFHKKETKKIELVPDLAQSSATNKDHRNFKGSSSHKNETENNAEDLNSSRSGKKTPRSPNTLQNWLSGSKKVVTSGGKSNGEVGDTAGDAGEETDAVLVVTYEESSPHRSPVRRPATGMLTHTH